MLKILSLNDEQVAFEGCCHGELDRIYATLAHLERTQGHKVDLLVCCGDFQVRGKGDTWAGMASRGLKQTAGSCGLTFTQLKKVVFLST